MTNSNELESQSRHPSTPASSSHGTLSMKSDVVFKHFFTNHPKMLKSFIADMLDLPIDQVRDLTLINTELPGFLHEDKFSHLDLSLQIRDQKIDIEIQVSNKKNYLERALYYWSKLYISNLLAGAEYSELKKTVGIHLVDFDLFDDPNRYHNEFAVRELTTGELLTRQLSLHFFELKKFARLKGKQIMEFSESKDLWIAFINASTSSELDDIKSIDHPVFNEAVQILTSMSQDSSLRALANARDEAKHEEASALAFARDEGFGEGFQKGEDIGFQKGRNETLKEAEEAAERKRKFASENLRQLGFSDAEICRILGS